MPKLNEMQSDLSDRLLLLLNTFRKVREGYLELDHQRAKTFQALLSESYEDALILEAVAEGAHRPMTNGVIVLPFPTPTIVVNNDRGPGHDAT